MLRLQLLARARVGRAWLHVLQQLSHAVPPGRRRDAYQGTPYFTTPLGPAAANSGGPLSTVEAICADWLDHYTVKMLKIEC